MKSRFVGLALLAVVMSMLMAGCGAYDRPEFQEISPSQTAFLIPMEGQTSGQQKFGSQEFYQKAMVATKRVQIPHRWIQEGRSGNDGKYVPTMRLLIVERKPVVREWTENPGTGTSAKNQGIQAESRESIGFMARMNCAAQIDETDAVLYLYRYNDKPLEEVMDQEIRARVESKFVEQCAHYPLSELLVNKDKIMSAIRGDVLPFFKGRGITITVLGLQGELTYSSEEIQKSINLKFTAAQEQQAQESVNRKEISKANALAQAGRTMAGPAAQSYLSFQLRNRALDNQAQAIQKWTGQSPNAVGAGTIFGIPFSAAAAPAPEAPKPAPKPAEQPAQEAGQ
ncbi:MAG: SPFH domain-containing protein [bacterium]